MRIPYTKTVGTGRRGLAFADRSTTNSAGEHVNQGDNSTDMGASTGDCRTGKKTPLSASCPRVVELWTWPARRRVAGHVFTATDFY